MTTFRIPDMTCGHCASTISRAIATVDRDAHVEFSIPDRLVRISASATEGELAEAIVEAGYTPEPAPTTSAALGHAAGGCCCAARKSAAPKR